MNTLKIAASGYVGGILYMGCVSAKRLHLKTDNQLYNYFTKMVAENYPKSCLVDNVTEGPLWMKVFRTFTGSKKVPEFQTMKLTPKANTSPGNFELLFNLYSYHHNLERILIIKLIQNVYITDLNIKIFKESGSYYENMYSMKNRRHGLGHLVDNFHVLF